MRSRARLSTGVRVGIAVLCAVGLSWLGTSDPARALAQVGVIGIAGVSLAVGIGWLRTPALLQPACAVLGAQVVAVVVARGGSIIGALPLAAAAGSVAALACWLPVRHHARFLPVTSLAASLALATMVVPDRGVLRGGRVLVAGVDLSASGPLLVVTAVLAALTVGGLERLRRSGAGRAVAVVARDPDLLARSGRDPQAAWAGGVALTGALAGMAGALAIVAGHGMPGAVAGVGALVILPAVVAVGGASAMGAIGGAAVLVALTPIADRIGVGQVGMAGLLLAVGLVVAGGWMDPGPRYRSGGRA